MSAALFPGIARWMGQVVDSAKLTESCTIKMDGLDKVVMENDQFSLGFLIPRKDNRDVDHERLKRRARACAVAFCRTVFDDRMRQWDC